MKYKVGDIVTIRLDLVGGKDYIDESGEETYCNTSMEQFAGKKAKVVRVDNNTYNVEVSGSRTHWVWSDSMLQDAPVTEEQEFWMEVDDDE